jgi:hypothetical protein
MCATGFQLKIFSKACEAPAESLIAFSVAFNACFQQIVDRDFHKVFKDARQYIGTNQNECCMTS